MGEDTSEQTTREVRKEIESNPDYLKRNFESLNSSVPSMNKILELSFIRNCLNNYINSTNTNELNSPQSIPVQKEAKPIPSSPPKSSYPGYTKYSDKNQLEEETGYYSSDRTNSKNAWGSTKEHAHLNKYPGNYKASEKSNKLFAFGNLGNTCYMNAFMSCFLRLKPIRTIIDENLNKHICSLLIDAMNYNSMSDVATFLSKNYKSEYFGTLYKQSDPYEFMNEVFLHSFEDVKDQIENVFCFEYCTEKTSKKSSTGSDVDIQTLDCLTLSSPQERTNDLKSLLQSVFKEKLIEVGTGKKVKKVVKKSTIAKCPQILFVRINLIGYESITGCEEVSIIEERRTEDGNEKDIVKYRLVGIIIYQSVSKRSGHYVAEFKVNGQVYRFNDRRVTPRSRFTPHFYSSENPWFFFEKI